MRIAKLPIIVLNRFRLAIAKFSPPVLLFYPMATQNRTCPLRALGLTLILVGFVLTGYRIFSFFSTKTFPATVSALSPVEGECRRVSGRKEKCLLQKLTLSYEVPGEPGELLQGELSPQIRTHFEVGDSLEIYIDSQNPNRPLVKTLSGGWGYRLAPFFLGLLLVILSSYRPNPRK